MQDDKFKETYIHYKYKRQKDKRERICRRQQERSDIAFKESSTRLTANFSSETIDASGPQDGTFKVLKEKTVNPTVFISKTVLQKLNLKYPQIEIERIY